MKRHALAVPLTLPKTDFVNPATGVCFRGRDMSVIASKNAIELGDGRTIALLRHRSKKDGATRFFMFEEPPLMEIDDETGVITPLEMKQARVLYNKLPVKVSAGRAFPVTTR